ncbi:MAG: DUF72 domain-containing protein [Candidatus Brocadiaceae bacterium]|nr:DUF72 domain-containing protein [Candidatus Brocadiaceae bacterium]
MRAGNAELYVGPAGWSYKDWEGIVYPQPKPRGFRPPQYLSRWFNTIELNNTFYRPPSAAHCARWVGDVDGRPGFLYTAKLWQRFTHERDGAWTDDEVRAFHDGIEPLREAGRLGALLMQFPWSFRYGARSEEHLKRLVGEFGDLPLVLEVRHRGWLQDQALRAVESLGVGFCNIDQPAFPSNLPLTSIAFGPVGYLRLHGRNVETWFAEGAGRDQRYDYLYKPAELDQVEAALRELADRVERLFVIANNHYRGQAVAAGLQVLQRFGHETDPPPGRVGELYGIP